MRQPHKHAALIKAWADGAEIQCRKNTNNNWVDLVGGAPSWFPEWEYRIKPKTVKYRLYLTRWNTVRSWNTSTYEPTYDFVKWLGNWQEVEV